MKIQMATIKLLALCTLIIGPTASWGMEELDTLITKNIGTSLSEEEPETSPETAKVPEEPKVITPPNSTEESLDFDTTLLTELTKKIEEEKLEEEKKLEVNEPLSEFDLLMKKKEKPLSEETTKENLGDTSTTPTIGEKTENLTPGEEPIAEIKPVENKIEEIKIVDVKPEEVKIEETVTPEVEKPVETELTEEEKKNLQNFASTLPKTEDSNVFKSTGLLVF